MARSCRGEAFAHETMLNDWQPVANASPLLGKQKGRARQNVATRGLARPGQPCLKGGPGPA
jgi:hypothetical protein